MIPLLLATRNAHKTGEFSQILGTECVVSDLTKLRGVPTVEETGQTFEENAVLKAVTISRTRLELMVADDSGLEIDVLEGQPGIFSARYSGENASDQQNIRKLLQELGDTKNRRARFRCAIALARDGKALAVFEGNLDGKITFEPRGKNGFGYDPVFIPAGYDRTLAELGEEVKNRISHRARAIARLREYLNSRV